MALQLPRQADFSANIFRRGQKRELFEDAEEEEVSAETELASKLGDLATLWAADRIGKELSAAIWRPSLGLAEVVLQRGKAVAHLGVQQRSRLYLHPEEATYLVDRANLLLFTEGPGRAQRLLSLQEAQDLMLGAGVGIDLYLVFCKLTRAGYIAQRHPARWIAGPGEDLGAVWARWRGGAGTDACLAGEGRGTAAATPDRDSGARPPIHPTARAPRDRPVPARPATARGQSRGWWALDGWAGVGPREGFWAAQPRAEVLQGTAAGRRAQYPCLQPLAQTSRGEVAQAAYEGGAASPRLHLDVWGADAKFSRRGAGDPLFHVSVHPAGAAPSLQEMVVLEAAAGDIPVKFAVVEKGDIGFYGFSHVRLQDIL
ncbi:hypothetical protein ACKKBG_A06385 [Auxenochlorella protothecoides x Auxenochlorella symbiontica]